MQLRTDKAYKVKTGSHIKSAVTRFLISIAILVTGAVSLVLLGISDNATWFVLTLGCIPVLASGLHIFIQKKDNPK